MKKLFPFLAIFLILVTSKSYSQLGWQTVNIGTYENLNSVSFPNVYTGYVAGNAGKFYKTTSAGNFWQQKPSPSNGNNLFVYFINAETGFVSSQGGFYKTINGGDNWTAVSMPSAYNITSICFSSSSIGWAGNTYGQILKTTNEGLNWSIVHTAPGYNSKIFFISDFTGWAVDTYGYVFRTTNSGTNFSSQRISTDTLSEIHFISSTIGMIAADSGRVFKTTNGGVNWTLLNPGLIWKLKSIFMDTPSIIHACGINGLVMRSTNGGNVWTVQIVTDNNLNQILIAPASTSGWLVGDVGTLAQKTTQSVDICIGNGILKTGYPFYTFYMDSRTDMLYLSGEIIAAGGTNAGYITRVGFIFDSVSGQLMNGFMIKMQNTSLSSLTGFVNSNWTTVYNGTYIVPGQGLQYIYLQTPFYYTPGSNLLVEICFNNNVYTYNSMVYSTNSPGKTYHGHQDMVSGNGCTDISTGSVYSSRPNLCIGINPLTETGKNISLLPREFKLQQNFPNPFNPVTKIRYEIPAVKNKNNVKVQLKIFDMLGREVQTLVNTELSPGFYEFDFDGKDFSSGVYFYSLISDGFRDTKRMVLMR